MVLKLASVLKRGFPERLPLESPITKRSKALSTRLQTFCRTVESTLLKSSNSPDH